MNTGTPPLPAPSRQPGDFASLLGTPLAFAYGAAVIALTVRAVTPLDSPSPRPGQPFSLILEGPIDTPLDQGTYRYTHPTHGEDAMFLVPIGQDATQRRYEAVFN